MLASVVESYFATPQNLGLSQLTEGFGLIYERAEDLDTLSLLLRRAFHEKQRVVIEAVVPSLDGLRQRGLLWREICAAVSALP